MRERRRVLFLSRLFSPFQIELGEALNRLAGIEYRVAFTMRSRQARGQPHWTSFDYDPERYWVMPDADDPRRWLAETIRRYRPDVLISGQPVGELYEAALATRSDVPFVLGFWMEPPDFTKPRYFQIAARQVARLRLAVADFVFAIGERAERYYAAAAPHAAVHLVPYGEDLRECFSATPEEKGTRTRFLFSGQLRAHHNVGVIADALVELAAERVDEFEFVLSGDGPERPSLDAAFSRSPKLRSVTRMDDQFATWSDRLRPFRQSHVLLYPCSYTGWGLVVPEAMAAGMVVLGARGAESVRYYLRHRVNGVVIEPSTSSLLREMRRCLDDPFELRRLAERARRDAHDGHAPASAERFGNALEAVLRNFRGRSARSEAAHSLELARIKLQGRLR